MTTVGSLAYSIVANTQQFTAGVAASRSELRTLKEAFLSSQSPTERFSMAIEHLEDLAHKFPEKAGVLHQTIHQMQHEMEHASPAGQALHHVMEHLGIVVDPVSAGFQAFHSVLHLVEEAFDKVKEIGGEVLHRMGELEQIGHRANLLGISPEAVVGLRVAAKELAGIDPEHFESAFKKFGAGLGEAAAEADGPAFKAFQRLHLSAEELSAMPLDKALLETAAALSKVENAAERLDLAKKLGGKGGAELAEMLSAGDEKIQEIMHHGIELQQMKFIDPDMIREANKSLREMHEMWEGVLGLLANDFSPLITDLVHQLDEAFGDAGLKGSGLRTVIQEVALTTAALVDEVEALNRVAAIAVKIATVQGGFEAAGRLLMEGGGPTHLQKLQDSLEKSHPLGEQHQTAIELGEKAQKASEAKAKKELDINARAAESIGKGMDQVNVEMMNHADKLREDAARAAEAIGKGMDSVNKEIADRGEKLRESLKTVPEKMRDDLAELEDLRRLGAIDSRTFETGLDNLREKAEQAAGIGSTNGSSIQAIHAGSVEALREGAGLGGKTDDKIEKNTADANKLLSDVIQAIKDNKPETLKEAV